MFEYIQIGLDLRHIARDIIKIKCLKLTCKSEKKIDFGQKCIQRISNLIFQYKSDNFEDGQRQLDTYLGSEHTKGQA